MKLIYGDAELKVEFTPETVSVFVMAGTVKPKWMPRFQKQLERQITYHTQVNKAQSLF